MMVMKVGDDWLDHVDPWDERDARDLLQAVQACSTVGMYACTHVPEDEAWLLMAAHAEAVLLLTTAAARQAFAALVRERFGLEPGHPATAWWACGVDAEPLQDADAVAANESRAMPLLEMPPVPRRC